MTEGVTTAARVVRIVLADDHPIFRDGLRRLLEAEHDLVVIGEASNADEALSLTRSLEPDILLLDLAMPRASGLEALRALADHPTTTRVILLTAAIEKVDIVKALQLGARGLVLKESATALLMKAIRTVMSGEFWVGRENVSDLVVALRALGADSERPESHKNFGLTDRELQITGLVVAAAGNKEIAEKLGISEKTVKHHLTNIFDKLGVSSRLELALFAINNNLKVS
jgi:two-component system, NarL family, nitrate/nitrite response regulator NarL